MTAAEEQLVARFAAEINARCDVSGADCWRCASCRAMQRGGSLEVWIQAFVTRFDPAWSVKQRNLRDAWNGHFDAWCVKCASRFLSRPPAAGSVWQRVVNFLVRRKEVSA